MNERRFMLPSVRCSCGDASGLSGSLLFAFLSSKDVTYDQVFWRSYKVLIDGKGSELEPFFQPF